MSAAMPLNAAGPRTETATSPPMPIGERPAAIIASSPPDQVRIGVGCVNLDAVDAGGQRACDGAVLLAAPPAEAMNVDIRVQKVP